MNRSIVQGGKVRQPERPPCRHWKSYSAWRAAAPGRLGHGRHSPARPSAAQRIARGKGFSERNIKRMLAFYRAYRDPAAIVPQPEAQLADAANYPRNYPANYPRKNTILAQGRTLHHPPPAGRLHRADARRCQVSPRKAEESRISPACRAHQGRTLEGVDMTNAGEPGNRRKYRTKPRPSPHATGSIEPCASSM
jgi:hypothetical protein